MRFSRPGRHTHGGKTPWPTERSEGGKCHYVTVTGTTESQRCCIA